MRIFVYAICGLFIRLKCKEILGKFVKNCKTTIFNIFSFTLSIFFYARYFSIFLSFCLQSCRLNLTRLEPIFHFKYLVRVSKKKNWKIYYSCFVSDSNIGAELTEFSSLSALNQTRFFSGWGLLMLMRMPASRTPLRHHRMSKKSSMKFITFLVQFCTLCLWQKT